MPAKNNDPKQLWRCYNCTTPTDFVGNNRVCPGCTLDGKTPDGDALIVARETIHYSPPHPVLKDKCTGTRLCDGLAITEKTGFMLSSHPDGATCPACLAKLVNPDPDPDPDPTPQPTTQPAPAPQTPSEAIPDAN